MIITRWLPLAAAAAGGTVAYGSQGTYLAYSSRTNSTLVQPASIANGDLLIAYLAVAASGASPTVTPPAGWTALTGSPISSNDGSLFLKYHVFYKIASGESGSYVFTHTAASSCGLIIRYTGVDTSTPFSPTPTTNTGLALTATATGFTTTNANTFVIYTEHDWADNTTNCTPPAGTTPTFTERQDDVLIYIADGTLAAAGATGDKSHTNNNASGNPWAAYLIGLKPGAAGGSDSVTVSAGSITLTGKTVTVSDSYVVSAGAFALSGKTVTVADGQSIPVTAGAIALSGKTVTLADSVAVAKATLTVAGKTVSVVDGDVVVVSVATITVAGKTVTVSDSVAVAKATLALTGKTVTAVDGDIVVIAKATLLLTGKTVTVSDSVAIAKATLALTGKTVSAVDGDIIVVSVATLTIAGKTVTVTDSVNTIPVSKGLITLSGGSITVTDTAEVPVTTPRAGGYDDAGRVKRRKLKGLRRAEKALERLRAEREQEGERRRETLEAQQRREVELLAELERLRLEAEQAAQQTALGLALRPDIAHAQQTINALLREAQRPIPPEMQQRLAANLAAEMDEEEALLLLLD